jgi:hypothetical protein
MVSGKDDNKAKTSKDRIRIGESLRGTSSIYTKKRPLTYCFHSYLCILLLPPTLQHLALMNTPQIRCQGCDKVFNPWGLSQHLSKPRNATCHAAQTGFKKLSVFQMSGEGSISNSRSCDDQHMDLVNNSSGEYYIQLLRESAPIVHFHR